MQVSSEPLAEVGVTDRQREYGKSAGHKNQVQHWSCSLRNRAAQCAVRDGASMCVSMRKTSAPSSRVSVAIFEISFRDGAQLDVIGIPYRCSAIRTGPGLMVTPLDG